MLVVDASCLYAVLVGTDGSEAIRRRMVADPDLAAPDLIDVEVLGVISRDRRRGRLDATAAYQAVDDLVLWPAERFGHRPLVPRAWELRDNVRTWDAMYVALAEALSATLITLDSRLAGSVGPECAIEVVAA